MGSQSILKERTAVLNVLHKKNRLNFSDHNILVLPLLGSYELIRFENIVYCSADSNYVNVFTKCGRKITLAKTLKWVQKQLNYAFVRTHQSYVINLLFVERYCTRNSILEMSGGQRVPVSRSMKKEVLRHFRF